MGFELIINFFWGYGACVLPACLTCDSEVPAWKVCAQVLEVEAKVRLMATPHQAQHWLKYAKDSPEKFFGAVIRKLFVSLVETNRLPEKENYGSIF